MKKLEQISEKEGLPVSYFVREGITLAIRKYSK